jgi:uncharacterized membrane protein
MEQMTHSEKRKMPRLVKDYDLFVREQDKIFRGKSRDVSLYGIGFMCNKEFAKGSLLDLTIYIMEANVNYDVKGVVRHCSYLNGKSTPSGNYLSGMEFTAGHEKGLPFIESEAKQSAHAVSGTVVIDRDIRTVYKKITDIESFPKWNPEIKITKVHERYPDGRCKKVSFEHQFLLLRVRYTDEYEFNDATFEMKWKSAGADTALVSNVGGYSLKATGLDKTAITFHANITLSLIPSNRLLNYFSSVAVRKALRTFKTLVESEK